MSNPSKKRIVVTWMTEPRLGDPVGLVDESKPVEGHCMRINLLITHDSELWYSQPASRWNMKAISRDVWDHYRPGHTDYFKKVFSAYDTRW